MKMCTQIETLLNKFMEQAILCIPLLPCSRLPYSKPNVYSFQQKLTVALIGKTVANPPHTHTHTYRVCTSIHIRLNVRTEEPTRGERTSCELGRKFLRLTLPALVIFCQSSLLSNFKAVLIVAGLKIRFHCGAHF